MCPLHVNIIYQYLVDGILDEGMDLIFLVQSLPILIFCTDDLEFSDQIRSRVISQFISCIQVAFHFKIA